MFTAWLCMSHVKGLGFLSHAVSAFVSNDGWENESRFSSSNYFFNTRNLMCFWWWSKLSSRVEHTSKSPRVRKTFGIYKVTAVRYKRNNHSLLFVDAEVLASAIFSTRRLAEPWSLSIHSEGYLNLISSRQSETRRWVLLLVTGRDWIAHPESVFLSCFSLQCPEKRPLFSWIPSLLWIPFWRVHQECSFHRVPAQHCSSRRCHSSCWWSDRFAVWRNRVRDVWN